MAAVLEAFASKLTDILVGMAKDEVEMLLGVPGEITKLETTLGDISSILADAERRRIRDSAVERWVRELKDVMYDADDILDLCQIMEGGEDPSSSVAAPKSTSGCWNISKMFFCFRNPVVAHEIGKKIQALNERLEDLEKRSSRFGFISRAINSSGYSFDKAPNSLSYNDRKTGPALIQSDIVGDKVEENKEELIDLLIEKDGESRGDNVLVAAAITGTGGIGKTTLARMVYNDSRVEESFDKRIWLSVNKEKLDQIGVLQNVIAALGGRSYDGSVRDKALLEHALKEAVRQKKFLLVMDDIWSESEHVWSELLRVPLNEGARGSRILVTTRNDGVARRMKARHLLRVNKLGMEDSWILLKKQAGWAHRQVYGSIHILPMDKHAPPFTLETSRGSSRSVSRRRNSHPRTPCLRLRLWLHRPPKLATPPVAPIDSAPSLLAQAAPALDARASARDGRAARGQTPPRRRLSSTKSVAFPADSVRDVLLPCFSVLSSPLGVITARGSFIHGDHLLCLQGV